MPQDTTNKTLQDTTRYHKSPQNTTRHHKIPQDTTEYLKTPQNRSTTRHHKIPQDTTKYHMTLQDTTRHHKIPQIGHHKIPQDRNSMYSLNIQWFGPNNTVVISPIFVTFGTVTWTNNYPHHQIQVLADLYCFRHSLMLLVFSLSQISFKCHVMCFFNQSEGHILSNFSDLMRYHEISPKKYFSFKEHSCETALLKMKS